MLDIQKEVSSLKDENKTFTFVPQIRLIDIIKEFSSPIDTKEGFPQIYKLPSIVTHIYPIKKLRKVTVGPRIISSKEEIKILVVGLVGAGKTTFINGFANYLYGVKWKDNCRFKIVSDEDEESDGITNCHNLSITDYVTAYTLYWQPGFAVPYTVTLIDTPGIGSLKGIRQDIKVIDQIESFLMNENDCGIDSINAVALTFFSSLNSHSMGIPQFIYDSIMKLFGIDIRKNCIIVATFADPDRPLLFSALNSDSDIPTTYFYKFNNGSLFEKCIGDDSKFYQLFWDIGQTSYENAFATAAKMSPKSLCHF